MTTVAAAAVRKTKRSSFVFFRRPKCGDRKRYFECTFLAFGLFVSHRSPHPPPPPPFFFLSASLSILGLPLRLRVVFLAALISRQRFGRNVRMGTIYFDPSKGH